MNHHHRHSHLLELLALSMIINKSPGLGKLFDWIGYVVLAVMAIFILGWLSHSHAQPTERASDPQILTTPTLEQCTYHGLQGEPLPHLFVLQGCPPGSDDGPPLQPGTPAQPEDLGYGSGRSDQLVPTTPSRERASDPLADRKALDTLLRSEQMTPLN